MHQTFVIEGWGAVAGVAALLFVSAQAGAWLGAIVGSYFADRMDRS